MKINLLKYHLLMLWLLEKSLPYLGVKHFLNWQPALSIRYSQH